MSLARRYRRLLLAYPRAYRRERGEEILGLLLDGAPAGRTRPTLREAADLVRAGLRCRLGRPASSTVGVWAVLTALICGLFTAALASRVAWETSRPQPDRAEFVAVFAEAFPGHRLGEDVSTARALFVFYGQPVSRASLRGLLLGDGGEYQEGSAGGSATGPMPTSEAETLATAQQRLRAAGWQVYEPTSEVLQTCADPRCDPASQPVETVLVARRGDTVLTATFDDPRSFGSYLGVALQRAAPPAVLPAAVLAGLLGGALAWLVFGWASRRTEGRRRAPLLLGVTLFFWWVPVLLATSSLARHHLDEPHPSWHPLWEWLGQPTLSLFFLIGLASALALLLTALTPRRDPRPLTARLG
ncbi:hypothetical protein GCE86_26160 [Micromonospora terminaliae]|uniref:Uncharacterized protein n=1 Tax=Micromonospora terminaliae TaxID=1914461 RepID=A0AAJ2ZC00_9ACTN|nr:hypothetical protein [Micromonospora terminaliae]NES25988.1 hypothetical protein [Micromonospora terminaliae]QGL50197.1 hypothetical protein GCE86_26160 [Micromonospora terminaliae]